MMWAHGGPGRAAVTLLKVPPRNVNASQIGCAQLMDILISGRAARGFILANWLYKDGPDKAQEWLDLTMKLLADGVMTPPSGE